MNLTSQKLGFSFTMDANNTDIVSDPVPVLSSRRLCGVLVATGDANGSFSFEVSSDGENWVAITAASNEFKNLTGSNKSYVVNLRSVPGTLWRILATRTGGASDVVFHYAA